MRKRIKSDQLKPGMYLQELCGAWIEHPFWRSSFLIKNERDIQRIVESGIREVVIDVSKGADIEQQRDLEAEARERAEATLRQAARSAAAPEPASLEAEVAQAARICARSKRAVKDMFHDVRLGKAVDVARLDPLVEEISASVSRHPAALLSLARVKSSDEYTYMHSVAVCALMIALARQLELEPELVREAGLGGLMHDVGKARVPLELLNKPDRLSDDEFALIKTHAEKGHAMLVADADVSDIVLDVVRHHHERLDGRGYPDRLPAEEISLFARMGAVCDVYDAVTSDRPYKRGWDPADAVRRMAEWTKTQFDEKIFQAFIKTIGIYPTGSLVRLRSGRLAVVVEQNAAALLAPKVKVFYSTSARARIPPKLLDLSRPGSNEAIAQRENPEEWRFDDLEALWSGMDDPRVGRA